MVAMVVLPVMTVVPVMVVVPLIPTVEPASTVVSVLSPTVMASASALEPRVRVSQLAELHRDTLVAFVLPMLTAAAPPASRVSALAPPLVMLRAPVAVRVVLVPRVTVPEPAWRVRLPAVVATVLAALPVMAKSSTGWRR